jgi:hypothetical protein
MMDRTITGMPRSDDSVSNSNLCVHVQVSLVHLCVRWCRYVRFHHGFRWNSICGLRGLRCHMLPWPLPCPDGLTSPSTNLSCLLLFLRQVVGGRPATRYHRYPRRHRTTYHNHQNHRVDLGYFLYNNLNIYLGHIPQTYDIYVKAYLQ